MRTGGVVEGSFRNKVDIAVMGGKQGRLFGCGEGW